MSERRRKLAWAAVIVASATAISRVVGLGREVITAGVYGVTADYNTFVSVSVVPNLIRQLFADAAISAAFVPVLTALLAAGDVERARRLTGTLLGFMLAVVGAVCVVLILAATPGRQDHLSRAHRHESDDAARGALPADPRADGARARARGRAHRRAVRARALHHAGRRQHRLEPRDHRLHGRLARAVGRVRAGLGHAGRHRRRADPARVRDARGRRAPHASTSTSATPTCAACWRSWCRSPSRSASSTSTR